MEAESIRWLYGLQRFGIKLGLEGIRALLERLGRPQSAFPSVLVGGTNGKGSVSAMLDSMLAASGRRTGLYTSPHLVRPNERVRVGGSDIGTAELCRCLDAVRVAAEEVVADGTVPAHPSFFEVMTAAALLAFRDAGIDAAVLEVGLGGRLDATNAVDAQLSCIVTVDLDHTDRLGTTLAAIAEEKAGIVKAGRPLVTGVDQPEALEVLRRRCREAGVTMVEVRRVATIHGAAADGTFGVETSRGRYDALAVPLAGAHQIENARVAVVTLEEAAGALGLDVRPEAVRRGLAAIRWPGRLQRLPGRPGLLLDGAHNPAGAAVLARHLRDRGVPAPVLLFAATAGKDIPGILAPLAGLVGPVVVTRAPVDRAADPADLAETAARLGLRSEVVVDPRAALDRARSLAGTEGTVLVAGSLYLVGAVLAALEGVESPGPVAL